MLHAGSRCVSERALVWPRGSSPASPPEALALSRRIWNLRARSERGEDVAEDLKAALADLQIYRCRDVRGERAIMSKLCRLDPEYWPLEDFGYWCPGCNSGHEIAVTKKNASNASWTFNGNFQRPTFSPSLHLENQHTRHGRALSAGYQVDRLSLLHPRRPDRISRRLPGHALRGQTVDLPWTFRPADI